MSRLYLITGFLGAGKTTFLRNFIKLFRSSKPKLIINEFGRESVDGALLSDIDAELKEILGGSIFCPCRSGKFEEALRQCGENETVLAEASGLSDPTGVRRLFSDTARFPDMEYMGAVCLADAVRFPKVYASALSCARQIAASDVILLNKTDLASESQISEAVKLIKTERPDIPIIKTSFGNIPSNFLNILSESQNGDRKFLPAVSDLSINRITLVISPEISAAELEAFIRTFSDDAYRVKGFVKTRDKGNMLADCVGNIFSVKAAELKVKPESSGVLNILARVKSPVDNMLSNACERYKKYVVSIN